MTPTSAQEMAAALEQAASQGQTVCLQGAGTKAGLAGQPRPCNTTIFTTGLNRVLQYEPKDLTISVEAGMPYRELTRMLAENRQMIPLDPPWADAATIGGVIATNGSGPRRRMYGTARDLVIGIRFATLEGKLVDAGGMVVKNVAGLDFGKLLIGSYGTLAAITNVNFKLTPMPEGTRTFLKRYGSVEECFAARDGVLKGVLQPLAIDVLNPLAAGVREWVLAIRAGGSEKVLNRYGAELAGFEVRSGPDEDSFWTGVQEYLPGFVKAHVDGAVVRIASKLTDMAAVMAAVDGAAIGRAGTGVVYAFLKAGARAWSGTVGGESVYEWGGGSGSWPAPGDSAGMMEQVKEMMDPKSLLNPGRYYGRF